MRSRNDSPGLAVIFTLIQSDITVVPPVTPLRSSPLSRMTGADSPVIAACVYCRDALDHLAIAGNPVACGDHHDVFAPELRCPA